MTDGALQQADMSDETFRTDGHCLCKRVSYMLKQSNEPLPSNLICHCHNCRRISGTAFATNIIASKKVYELPTPSQNTQEPLVGRCSPSSQDLVWRESVPGSLHLYVDPDTESGKPMSRWFCGNCGNPVFATTKVWDDVVSVFAGTLVDQQGWKPAQEIFTDTKAPWLPDFGIEDQSGRGPPT